MPEVLFVGMVDDEVPAGTIGVALVSRARTPQFKFEVDVIIARVFFHIAGARRQVRRQAGMQRTSGRR